MIKLINSRRLELIIVGLILAVVIASGLLSWQLSLKPEERVVFRREDVEKKEELEIDSKAIKARKVFEETLKQQATMASSIEETTVPNGCDELAWQDPLIGVLRFRSSDLGQSKSGSYWYLAKLLSYKEEERGSCIDSVLSFEYLVGGQKRNFDLRLPKQMLGKGSMGVILPKVVGYKTGLRVEMVVDYEVKENESLRVKEWNVETLYVD